MNMPGFTAEASIYVTQSWYRVSMQGSGSNDSVALAGACTCTDSNCTWSCPVTPPPPPPPDECAHLKGAARCNCEGGLWRGNPPHCIFF